jgi:hypothetical protein
MAIDGAALGAGLVGGAGGGAALTAGVAAWHQRAVRKGQARILHEDLIHLQATLARTFYAGPGAWWEDGWLLPYLSTSADRRDLFAKLDREEYAAVASALGWMEYLAKGKAADRPAPSDDEVRKIYARLAAARYALSRVGDIDYRPHRHTEMKETGSRTDGETLPDVDAKQAKSIVRRAPGAW